MHPRPRFYRFVQWAARTLLFAPLGGIRTIGLENVPETGAVLFAPVHLSFADPPVVGCITPRYIRFMAKEELFRPVLLGWLLRHIGVFPVRRGQNDTAAVRFAIELLRNGHTVLAFPEGTRGDGRVMQPIQPGLSMLAKRSGACVVPIGLSGTERLLPRGKSFPKRVRVTMVYGKPFRYEDVATHGDERQNREAFARELANRIAALCGEAGLSIRTGQSSSDLPESDCSETKSESPSP